MKIAIDMGGDSTGSMLTAQELRPAERSVLKIGGGSIGVLGGEVRRSNGNILAVAGFPIPRPDLDRITSHREATRLLPQCDGAFVAVFWDAADRKLVVVTDFLAMKPFYIERRPGRLRLACETKAFASDTPDLAAWGAFLAFGHTIGYRTLVAGVEQVPAATVLVYEPETDKLESRSYWRWPEDRRPVHRSDLLDALRRSVSAYANAGPPGTLLLSGGFDSRLILFLLKEAGLPTRALIVGHPDELFDADGRLAKAVASASGTPYCYRRPSADFFSTPHYLEYLAASDAATPSLYLFIAQVAQFIDDAAVWEGLVPGFTLASTRQPRGGFAAYLQRECRERDDPIWRAAGELFRDDVVNEMHNGLQTDLWRELPRYPDDSSGVNQFVIRNRIRNRMAINPFKVFCNYSQVYSPGLTRDFVELAACVPHEEKIEARLYLDLMRDLSPRLLDMPLLSAGKLYDGQGRFLRSFLNTAVARTDRFLARHPRVARRLGLGGARPARSKFLDRPWTGGPDPLLKPDPGARSPLSGPAEKLLFHWRAWRSVHSGDGGAALRGAWK